MASCPDNSVFVAGLFLHCPCKNLATRDHALFRLVNLLKVLYGVTEPVLSCENQAGSRWAVGVTYCHCVAAFADPMYCIWALTYCGHWQSDSDCCRKIWSGHVSIRYPYELEAELCFFCPKPETVLAVTFWKVHRASPFCKDDQFVELAILSGNIIQFCEYQLIHQNLPLWYLQVSNAAAMHSNQCKL
jgi:hypothetical protein